MLCKHIIKYIKRWNQLNWLNWSRNGDFTNSTFDLKYHNCWHFTITLDLLSAAWRHQESPRKMSNIYFLCPSFSAFTLTPDTLCIYSVSTILYMLGIFSFQSFVSSFQLHVWTNSVHEFTRNTSNTSHGADNVKRFM